MLLVGVAPAVSSERLIRELVLLCCQMRAENVASVAWVLVLSPAAAGVVCLYVPRRRLGGWQQGNAWLSVGERLIGGKRERSYIGGA